jgi:hypothetical protein
MGGSTRTPGPSTGSNQNGRQPGPVNNGPGAGVEKAADATETLRAYLPDVLKIVTPQQLRQVQKVFDAAAYDPAIKQEADDLYRRAQKRYGSLVVEDEELVRRGDRVMKRYIYVTEAEKRIRLDFTKLLDSGAFKPKTDNPDEVTYLNKVNKSLESYGVWLRMQPKLVRRPDDPSSRFYDPHQFEMWLSVGNDGETVPTKSGHLDRETILGTSFLGAGYYEQVYQGPVQKALDRAVATLRSQISTSETLWEMEERARSGAAPLVVPISDTLGGASFPSRSIFDRPHALVVKALESNINGNVMKSMVYLMAASYKLRDAAQQLDDYINATVRGAERAVGVLRVLKVAGEVAGVILTVVGVGSFIRGAGAAVEASTVDAAAEKFVGEYVAKNPEIAADLTDVRWVRGPKGSVGGGIKPGTSSGAGEGFHKW